MVHRCSIVWLPRVTSLLLVMIAFSHFATCASAQRLQELIDKSDLEYVKTKDGAFKVLISHEGDNILVVIREVPVYTEDDGTEVKLAYLFASISNVPADFKHPPQMLKQIARINDELTIGRVGITDDGSVFYNSSFWLSTATPQVLTAELGFALLKVLELQPKLKGFVEEN